MAATITFPLMTVEDYQALPEPRGDFDYELQFGKLVRVGRANTTHWMLQRFIRDLIASQIDTKRWTVDIEMPYNLTEGYDARAADVGVVLTTKLADVGDGWLSGSPELIVFVKSRSNSDKQIEQNAIECLTHGAKAAWYVKLNPAVVIVYTASGRKEYRAGQSIPLPSSMPGRVKVRDIFRDLVG